MAETWGVLSAGLLPQAPCEGLPESGGQASVRTGSWAWVRLLRALTPSELAPEGEKLMLRREEGLGLLSAPFPSFL